MVTSRVDPRDAKLETGLFGIAVPLSQNGLLISVVCDDRERRAAEGRGVGGEK